MSPKLPALKPKEVVRILEKAGYYVKRQTGSHVILVNEDMKKVLPVPWHNRDLKTGTLHGIIKRSGLTEEEFLNLR